MFAINTPEGVFSSPETVSKGDEIKIKRKVSLFAPSPPDYLAFTVVLSLFSSFLHGISKPEKSSEIEVKPTRSASFS